MGITEGGWITGERKRTGIGGGGRAGRRRMKLVWDTVAFSGHVWGQYSGWGAWIHRCYFMVSHGHDSVVKGGAQPGLGRRRVDRLEPF